MFRRDEESVLIANEISNINEEMGEIVLQIVSMIPKDQIRSFWDIFTLIKKQKNHKFFDNFKDMLENDQEMDIRVIP